MKRIVTKGTPGLNPKGVQSAKRKLYQIVERQFLKALEQGIAMGLFIGVNEDRRDSALALVWAKIEQVPEKRFALDLLTRVSTDVYRKYHAMMIEDYLGVGVEVILEIGPN